MQEINLAIPASISAASPASTASAQSEFVRESLVFLFSNEGHFFREMILDEVSAGIDALSREALFSLLERVGVLPVAWPRLLRAVSPELSPEDRRVVESTTKLIQFLAGGSTGSDGGGDGNNSNNAPGAVVARLLPASLDDGMRRMQAVRAYAPLWRDFGPNMRAFGLQITERLVRKATTRTINAIFK